MIISTAAPDRIKRFRSNIKAVCFRPQVAEGQGSLPLRAGHAAGFQQCPELGPVRQRSEQDSPGLLRGWLSSQSEIREKPLPVSIL